MLILAGVTISGFIDGDGIFSRTTQVTREYKKQAMLEAVDLAKVYVELDKTYTNEPITIRDVIDKIKEVSTINEKDYIITVDDEEQTATIIDKATEVVVDVWIDENGHVQSDGNIVDDIENLVRPTGTYELDPPAGTYGEEVTITIVAKESKNGIVKTQFQNNAEKTYSNQKEVSETYTVTENRTYTFTAEGANGRKANKYIEVNGIDTTAPTTATISSSNVEETTFTLTATGADRESGIAKYEFYINNILEKTVTTTAGTVTYDVTGKTAVQVGDFVNYDAGTWTEADFSKITSSPGSPTVNKSATIPGNSKQFGGFVEGQSRNTNSVNDSAYQPFYSGWRVWDIDENTGEVTLISAGHPETYCHSGVTASTSVNILINRNWTMYENEYAKVGSAKVLTKEELDRWDVKYTDVDGMNIYKVGVGGGAGNLGIRVLVSLESDVQVEQGTATGGITTWNIVEN